MMNRKGNGNGRERERERSRIGNLDSWMMNDDKLLLVRFSVCVEDKRRCRSSVIIFSASLQPHQVMHGPRVY